MCGNLIYCIYLFLYTTLLYYIDEKTLCIDISRSFYPKQVLAINVSWTLHISWSFYYNKVPSNLWYKAHQIPKLKCFSSHLAVNAYLIRGLTVRAKNVSLNSRYIAAVLSKQNISLNSRIPQSWPQRILNGTSGAVVTQMSSKLPDFRFEV